MGQLIIKGDKKYLEIIKRENRLRGSKYNLSFEMVSEEAEGAPEKNDLETDKKAEKQPKKTNSKKPGK